MKRIAVDIGGTFTDFVYVNDEPFEMVVDKVRSTPMDVSRAVFEATAKIRMDMSKVELFVHGTTVGLNTVVQGKGARVGLITTEGFRDVLEMGRGNRKELYNYLWKKPKPLVARHLRLGIHERTDHSGRIIEKVHEDEVKSVVEKLRSSDVEAIAVCLLHSYTNPQNELHTESIIREVWPNADVSLSHQVAREFREYERMSTTVLDAYIKRQVVYYLSRLNENLFESGFGGQLLIVSSSGALGLNAVKERAIATFTSGPIGGVTGSLAVSNLTGIKDLVTMDVGGTSFDVSVIRNQTAVVRHQSELMGYPVLLPGMDIRLIGAGGGSIARVDVGGLLSVGPESAGAYPGPMCYGLGGMEPTVTDAALVNGLIDPGNFLGGEIKLDMDLALAGINGIAEKLGLAVEKTAGGILAVAQNNMTTATREMLIGQGHDPRDFTLISYGGGGGIFAAGVAGDLSIKRILIPPDPGVFSAWGMLSTDVIHAFSQTYARNMDAVDVQELNRIYRSMEESGRTMLREEKIADDAMEFVRSLDMCYQGQGHYVDVPMANRDFEESAKTEIEGRFHALHQIRYGYRMDRSPKTINVRVKAIGRIKKAAPTRYSETAVIRDDAIKRARKVFFKDSFIPWKVLERAVLLPGNSIKGPAILEEPYHTTVVYPGQTVRVDSYKNLVIEFE